MSISVWDNIKPILLELMENVKDRRLKAEFRDCQKARRSILKEVYQNYAATQPPHAVVPGIADVALLFPAFTALVDSPVEEDPTADQFKDALKEIPSFAAGWRTSKQALLFSLMKKVIPEAKEEDIYLPTAFFQCQFCYKPFNYDRLFLHRCLTFFHRTPSEDYDIFSDLGCQTWNRSGYMVAFDGRSYEAANSIIQKYGLEGETIAADSVTAPTIFFRCKDSSCSKKLFTWPGAVCVPVPLNRRLLSIIIHRLDIVIGISLSAAILSLLIQHL